MDVVHESDRISDQETLETIKFSYKEIGYALDPHTAVGVTAAKRSISQPASHLIVNSTSYEVLTGCPIGSQGRRQLYFRQECAYS